MDDRKDRLSDLPDDLLRRILHFVLFKEAASTAVLSRRWGSLWRSCGAVNLAVRVHDEKRDLCSRVRHDTQKADEALFSRRDDFVRAAEAALAAADARLTRLTLHVEADHGGVFDRFLHRSNMWKWNRDLDVIGDLLSHPAARRVEELRVAVVDTTEFGIDNAEVYWHRGVYSVVSLPSSETLRVLDLTNCYNLSVMAAFPRLATLRLRLCSVQLMDLQALFDAAPELAIVHLEGVFFKVPQYDDPEYDDPQFHGAPTEPPVVRLRCPAATAVVLALCGCGLQGQGSEEHDGGDSDSWAIEIEAPRLRSFRYKGAMRRFQLGSPAPDMERVDLHFLDDDSDDYHYHHDDDEHEDEDEDKTRVLFWQFVQNFTNARALKLKVNYLKDIAAIGKARRAELLCAFPNVESLQLEGAHRPTSKTAAVAIANLLQCCPGVRVLTLKLSTVPSNSEKDSRYAQPFLQRKDRLDYNNSIDRFKHRTSKPVISSMEHNSGDEVPDIPGLTRRSFACLQSSLRRVSLQFRRGNSSCLGVRLVKFFADNAMVLEEMRVDSGNRRLFEHMNLNRRNLAESSRESSKFHRLSLDSTTELARSTAGFTVLPLQRRTRMDCKS